MKLGKEHIIKFYSMHLLPNEPNKCHRPHGHNFYGDVIVNGKKVDEKTGYLDGMNFNDIVQAVNYVCEKLEGFFKMVPDARKHLDGIRSRL